MDTGTVMTMIETVYEILGETLDGPDLVCGEGCAACCTRNVPLTSLETLLILTHLDGTSPPGVAERLAAAEAGFVPRTTTNAIAAALARGEEPIPETEGSSEGTCPFLADDCCAIYPVRPLACRCMVSTVDCRKTGCAEADPFRLTVGTAFLQVVEHLDARGFTGNLIDMIPYLAPLEMRDACRQGTLFPPPERFVPNAPLTVLMVPPRHRERLRPILSRIHFPR